MFIRQMKNVVECMRWQYREREKIEARQINLINGMLACSRSVPYYMNRACEYPASIGSMEEFKRAPIIKKRDVKGGPEELFLNRLCDKRSAVSCSTSGSTGEPMTVYHDKITHDYHTAAGVRRVLASGIYRPRFRLLHIRPNPIDKRLFEYLGLFRRDVVPASLPMSKIKTIILSEKPDGLVGYPVYFRDLLAAMSDSELKSVEENLKIIFTESELLSDHHRMIIEAGFGVKVFDDYSAYETLSITFECSHRRHHIVEDRIYLEIVDDDGKAVADGVEGNIVITSFMERAMPLIRYWIGDKGILSEHGCSCGRTFKTLVLTQGRTEDFIVLPNGRRIYCATLLYLAAQLDRVRECFVYQKRDGKVVFYYVPLGEARRDDACIRNRVVDYLSSAGGGMLDISIKMAESIPRTHGGKARLMYSELAH